MNNIHKVSKSIILTPEGAFNSRHFFPAKLCKSTLFTTIVKKKKNGFAESKVHKNYLE